jgi:hypothetical protein
VEAVDVTLKLAAAVKLELALVVVNRRAMRLEFPDLSAAMTMGPL